MPGISLTRAMSPSYHTTIFFHFRTGWMPSVRGSYGSFVMRSSFTPLVKFLAGVAILMLGDSCFTSRARAGCGDHVQTQSERNADPSMKTARQSMAPDGPLTHRPHVPCSGPNCSARDDFPPSPPVPAWDFDERAILPIGISMTPNLIVRDVGFLVPGACVGLLSSIFHPPRRSH